MGLDALAHESPLSPIGADHSSSRQVAGRGLALILIAPAVALPLRRDFLTQVGLAHERLNLTTAGPPQTVIQLSRAPLYVVHMMANGLHLRIGA